MLARTAQFCYFLFFGNHYSPDNSVHKTYVLWTDEGLRMELKIKGIGKRNSGAYGISVQERLSLWNVRFVEVRT
jgi:hypothetical protein